MEIGKVVKENRKRLGYTQEQLASYLGISAPAVNKWEKGASYPDITLLAPIARLFDINIDTLLSFSKKISNEEVETMAHELIEMAKTEGVRKAYEAAEKYSLEYPNSPLLFLRLAQIFDTMLTVYDKDIENQDYIGKIRQWYKRAITNGDKLISETAISLLIANYQEREDFELAQQLIDTLEEPVVDKRIAQCYLFMYQKRYEEAYVVAEETLLSKITEMQRMLSSLVGISIRENNLEATQKYEEYLKNTAALFPLFPNNEEIAPFQVGLLLKDEEKCLNAMEKIVTGLNESLDNGKRYLFRHINQGEENLYSERQMLNLLKMMFKEVENIEFIREDKRFQDIMSKL